MNAVWPNDAARGRAGAVLIAAHNTDVSARRPANDLGRHQDRHRSPFDRTLEMKCDQQGPSPRSWQMHSTG